MFLSEILPSHKVNRLILVDHMWATGEEDVNDKVICKI